MAVIPFNGVPVFVFWPLRIAVIRDFPFVRLMYSGILTEKKRERCCLKLYSDLFFEEKKDLIFPDILIVYRKVANSVWLL